MPVTRADEMDAPMTPVREARDQIAVLAHRFWSIHPREIQDMGLTREQFYVREIAALVDTAEARLREALQTAIGHIEHMAAFITNANSDYHCGTYSFESLGEDMPGIRKALSPPSGGDDVDSLTGTADDQGLFASLGGDEAKESEGGK